MITSRIGVNGTYNLAYGIDGIFSLFGNDYLDLKWSQSFENDVKTFLSDEPSRIWPDGKDVQARVLDIILDIHNQVYTIIRE